MPMCVRKGLPYGVLPKDLCSGTHALSGEVFPFIFPCFARTHPEYCLLPLHSLALLGAIWSL